MNLPAVSDLDLKAKTVLVRADLDGTTRLKFLLPLLKKLLASDSKKIVLIGHQGRPTAPSDGAHTLKPFTKHFSDSLKTPVEFMKDIPAEIQSKAKIILLENLRFHPEEEANDPSFAAKLANLADIYVNEAFAVSHREHASIVALPQAMKKQNKPVALGPHFISELENLNKVLTNPTKPVVSILSGVKKDKLDHLEGLIKISDQVLIAGRLPEYLDEDYKHPKVTVARLMPDKEDITLNSIEKFESVIKSTGTLICSGVPGKFEDQGHRQSTERVYRAIADSNAYKLAGGGDTTKAITELKLEKSFDWISTGGGSMLHYLTHQSLPALKAVQ